MAKTLISGAVGAAGGAIAATGLHWGVQAAYTALSTGIGDIATQAVDYITKGTKYNVLQTIHNSILGAGCSALGSALGYVTSYGRNALGQELLEQGSIKATKAIVRNSIGKSSSKLAFQAKTLVSEGIKQINTARGISSVTGTLMTWGLSVQLSY